MQLVMKIISFSRILIKFATMRGIRVSMPLIVIEFLILSL